MRLNNKDLLVYPVFSFNNFKDEECLVKGLEDIFQAGIKIIQLREKMISDDEYIRRALLVKDICDKYGIKLIINDNVDVAKQVNASGVHLGQDDLDVKQAREELGDNVIIGLSIQNKEQLSLFDQKDVDYLGVGAMFTTDSKDDASMVSIDELNNIIASTSLPVIGIGGINLKTLPLLKNVKLAGIAVIGAIFKSDNLKVASLKLISLCKYYFVNKLAPCLSIAGSDCSGGAGIQADLKSMLATNSYGMSVITSITAQNTVEVSDVYDLPSELVGKELDSVFLDIYPLAIKIGMVSNIDIIRVISHKLKVYEANNIVVDPVMVSTSGCLLIDKEAIEVLKNELFPLATLLTPNIYEAEILSDISIKNADDMEKAAKLLGERYHCSVLVKGGHAINDANDVLYDDGELIWYHQNKIDNDNTHGTGCSLSSSIASYLAQGYELKEAISKAKAYLTHILSSKLDLGNGSGPMDHGYHN